MTSPNPLRQARRQARFVEMAEHLSDEERIAAGALGDLLCEARRHIGRAERRRQPANLARLQAREGHPRHRRLAAQVGEELAEWMSRRHLAFAIGADHQERGRIRSPHDVAQQ